MKKSLAFLVAVILAISLLLPSPIPAKGYFVVASADATATEKMQADFLCDAVGTDDNIQIQAAINAASMLPQGGKVLLSKGLFSGGPLVMKSNVVLSGAGPSNVNLAGITKYKLKNGANATLLSGGGAIVSRSIISNIFFDANKANQGAGNYYGIDATGFQYSDVDHVTIAYAKSHGWFIDGAVKASPNLAVSFLGSYYNGGDGFHIVNEKAASWYISIIAAINAGNGVYRKNNVSQEFSHSGAGGNGLNGWYTENDLLVHDYQLHSESSQKSGFYYKNIGYSQISDLFSQQDCIANTDDPVVFYGGNSIAVTNVVVNNYLISGAGRYGLKVAGPSIFNLTGGTVTVYGVGATALYYEATHARIIGLGIDAPSGTKVLRGG